MTREKEPRIVTPACLLKGRIHDPIIIERKDHSCYMEADISQINELVDSECVEGVARRNGTLKRLRMLFDETETIKRLAEHAQKHAETPCSILSGASKTVFREKLTDGHFCFALKPMRDGWNRLMPLRMAS